MHALRWRRALPFSRNPPIPHGFCSALPRKENAKKEKIGLT
jgi:hypothetical protein